MVVLAERQRAKSESPRPDELRQPSSQVNTNYAKSAHSSLEGTDRLYSQTCENVVSVVTVKLDVESLV